MLEQHNCQPDMMGLFLEDSLDADESAAFEYHLECCADCREQLQRSAAHNSLWNEVRETFRGQSLNLPASGPKTSTEAIWRDKNAVEADFDDAHDNDPDASPEIELSLLRPTDEPNMLGRFGGYEIAGVIGRGGMGVVFKAFDRSLHRYVAIKALSPHLAASGAARKRFSREAQAAAAVVHENVIAIHSVADDNRHPYLVMPYERGCSLQKRLDENGPLGVVELLRIGMQAAAGLAAAHAQGLVHRDVKPANILLAEGVERIKLTDFGLARAADDASLTRTGLIAGTPQYMSPEQARGEAVDHRSDLFSLGSVLYVMCTARLPFSAETSYGILRRVTDSEAPPIREINPEIPIWLCHIVEKLLAKSPADRYQSAAEVSELLGQCLSHKQHPSRHSLPSALQQSLISSAAERTRLRDMAIWLLPLSAFAIAISTGLAAWSGFKSSPDSIANEERGATPAAPLIANSDHSWNILEQPLREIDESTRDLAARSALDIEVLLEDNEVANKKSKKHPTAPVPPAGNQTDDPTDQATPLQPSVNQANNRLAEIGGVLKDFIRDHKSKATRLERFIKNEAKTTSTKMKALGDVADVKLELARLLFKLAKTQTGETQIESKQIAKDAYKETETYLSGQIHEWATAALTAESKIGNGLSGEAAKEHIKKLRVEQSQYFKTILAAATCLEEGAETCVDAKDSERLLTRAEAAYQDIFQEYRTRLLGLHARLCQARCLRKLTRNNEAVSACEEILSQPDSPAAMRNIRTKALLTAMHCWLDGDAADHARAAKRGAARLKQKIASEKNAPDWKELEQLVKRAKQLLLNSN